VVIEEIGIEIEETGMKGRVDLKKEKMNREM
jgi:hypothetical protein